MLGSSQGCSGVFPRDNTTAPKNKNSREIGSCIKNIEVPASEYDGEFETLKEALMISISVLLSVSQRSVAQYAIHRADTTSIKSCNYLVLKKFRILGVKEQRHKTTET